LLRELERGLVAAKITSRPPGFIARPSGSANLTDLDWKKRVVMKYNIGMKKSLRYTLKSGIQVYATLSSLGFMALQHD
jgi:hypothetical protein